MEETYAQFVFKEKRKWQIALRRYVLEKKPSAYYALYFGLDISTFREWIEIQFDDVLSWSNFSTHWQFDHIIPVAYFDLRKEEDLQLCWNFTNIRIEKCDLNKNRGNRLDVMAAKTYYETLQQETSYHICQKMITKINTIEISQIQSNLALESFIRDKKEFIESVQTFTPQEFAKLNEGIPLEEIMAERELLRKFGG
jgi:hypothetical protein